MGSSSWLDKILNFSITHWFFWSVLPGPIVSVKWPSGKIIIVDDEHPDWDWTLGATKQEVYSSDPNDFYRDWMHTNIGRQGRDWDWRIGKFEWTDTGDGEFKLEIKIRQSKAQYASIILMKWS